MHTISVIISAFNCEKTLERAVDSVIHQLGDGDEIIIVDDCSDDGTFAIASKLASDNPKVKAFRTQANGGCLAARGEGVFKSSCDRIMFLDGDDEYYGHALSTVRNALEDNDVDVLHFGLDLWAISNGIARYDESASRWFVPHDGFFTGRDVFTKCFIEHKYNWNLVNKCFDADVCRKACCFLPPYRIQRGEDAYLYFVISYFADSYCGLRDARLYRYNFGLGQDTDRIISIAQFKSLCKSSEAARAIQDFMVLEQADEVYRKGAREARKALARGCSNKIRDQLKPSDRGGAINVLIAEWGMPDAIDALRHSLGADGGTLARSMLFQPGKPLSPGDTIASFYWAFSGGGAENVQRMLVKTWQKIGLKVVLLMERKPDEAAVSELGVEYRVISEATGASCSERIAEFERIADEFKIAGVVYHQWASKQLFWDLLAFKSMGIPFFIHCHGIFSHYTVNGDGYYSRMPDVYRHADGIVSLSSVDAMYWRMFNPRVFVTVNPPTFERTSVVEGGGSRVLWLGRISREKRPEEALEVIAELLKLVPDVKVDFVGGSIDPNYERSVVEKAEKLGIDGSVNFTGWCEDRRRYYERARVFLMTSDPKEGYPLTLGECQSMGVPCVMYELPYLTLARESGGIAQVPFGDKVAAAHKIAELLVNDEEHMRMREAALDMCKRLETFDFEGLWKTVLMSRKNPEAASVSEEDQLIAWRTLASSYEMGCNHKLSEADRLKREVRKQKNEIARLKNAGKKDEELINELKLQLGKAKKREARIRKSVSFRLGRSMTAIPRWIKRNIAKNKQ